MALNNEIYTRIAELRKDKSWSQGRLAEKAGLDWKTVRNAEIGKNTGIHVLVKIASALKVPFIEIFKQPLEEQEHRQKNS